MPSIPRSPDFPTLCKSLRLAPYPIPCRTSSTIVSKYAGETLPRVSRTSTATDFLISSTALSKRSSGLSVEARCKTSSEDIDFTWLPKATSINAVARCSTFSSDSDCGFSATNLTPSRVNFQKPRRELLDRPARFNRS